MRRTVIVLACLLCPAALSAAPVPAVRPPAATPVTQAHLQAAARDYANNVAQVLATVEQYYARPVSRAELIEAALAGLYETAGVPVPAGLKADVQRAAKDNALLAQLTRTRADLGNVEALQGRRAILASCRAMTRALDPFCGVVTGEEAATATGFDQNYGLGIDLLDRAGTGPVVIKTVVPGGPAQRAGLQAGDHVTQVDGKETKDLTTEQALRLLNGAGPVISDLTMPLPATVPGDLTGSSSPVRLTVRGAGGKERSVTVFRGYFEPETVQGVSRGEDNSWNYWVDRPKGIAQIRVAALARHTGQELERVLIGLDGLRGLILDLRWCPGGYLDPSIDAAGLFLSDGVVATIKSRGPDSVQQARDGGARKFLDFPVVVLVNAETSGGGELIAAALQDHKRAAVAGQRTRGKASIQTQTTVHLFADGGRLDGSLQLKLTNGTFLRPSGKALNRFADSKPSDDWGVRPDPGRELRVSAELSRQLREWWHEQSLRPGASNKALPLDDPEADPQRQAALKMLRGLMAEK